MRNHPVAAAVAGFTRIWLFRFNLRGCGFLIRICNRVFPHIDRYFLEYPGLGTCNIRFLDLLWLRQTSGGRPQEEAVLKALAQFLPPSSVIWDVGANSGCLAAELLLRLKPARLELFEPNPIHKQTLDSLAGLDGRIRVHMTGLSDKSGECVLFVPGGRRSGSSCATVNGSLVAAARGVQQLSIHLESADRLVTEGVIDVPDLVVIDVEGHEAAVVAGMTGTIAQARPILVLESIFLSDHALNALVPSGYRMYSISDRDGALVAGIRRDIGHNVIFLPGETTGRSD